MIIFWIFTLFVGATHVCVHLHLPAAWACALARGCIHRHAAVPRHPQHGPAIAGPARTHLCRNRHAHPNGGDEPRHLLAPGALPRRRPDPLLRRRRPPVRAGAGRRAGGASAGHRRRGDQPALRPLPARGELHALPRPLLHLHADRQDHDPPRRRQLRGGHGRRTRPEGRGDRDATHPAPDRARSALRQSRRQAGARSPDGRASGHRQDDARESDRVIAACSDLHRRRRFLCGHVPGHRRAQRLPDGSRGAQEGEDVGRLHRFHRRDRRPRPEAVGRRRRRRR